jgi:DNA repair photolyase
MALVGIARMAAESPLLEAKRRVQYFEIGARSILNRTKPHMPFQWTINPYRGCEFGCKYCYARYTYEYMEMPVTDFEDKIYAKSGVAHLLRQELRHIDRRERIALGTATDPYQPAERRYGRTRSVLEVFARETGWHLGIVTKSDLVTRDIDLLKEVGRRNVLSVNLTITTLDEKMARLTEPRAPRPALRLEAVRKLSEAGLRVGVYAKPILPGLTDGERALDRLAKAARDAGAQVFGGGAVFLMPCAMQVFLPFLEKEFPELAPRYRERFATTAYVDKAYKDKLAARVHQLRERYGFDSDQADYKPELWNVAEQPTLFPLQ